MIFLKLDSNLFQLVFELYLLAFVNGQRTYFDLGPKSYKIEGPLTDLH